MTDEQFAEATGGLQKADIHELMVAMRSVCSVTHSIQDTDGRQIPFIIRPENMENGALIPQLSIEADGVTTQLMSMSGVKCAFTVSNAALGVSVDGDLTTKRGIEVQNEADFRLIPDTHWQILRLAKTEIERQNPKNPEPGHATRKRGGFLTRLGRKK